MFSPNCAAAASNSARISAVDFPAEARAAAIIVRHSLSSMKRAASNRPASSSGGTTRKPCLSAWIKLAGLDLAAKDLDFAPPAHGRGVGVAHAQPPGQRLEARAVHLVQVADGAVDDRAHAAQRAVEIAGDLAPEGPDHAGLVEVLDHHDLRPRHAADVLAVFAPGVGILRRCAGLLGSKTTVTA